MTDSPIFDLPENLKNVARYMWSVFCEATNFQEINRTDGPIRIHKKGAFPISESFEDLLNGNIEAVADKYDLPEGLHTFREMEPIACAFYLLNSLHEHLLPPNKTDKYGRYPYEESIQYRQNIVEENLVQSIFDQHYALLTGQSPRKSDSRIFWTHDIDYLYSAWKHDLIVAARNPLCQGLSGIWNAVTKPSRWNNIIEMIELENKFGIRSVYFWLAQRGKVAISKDIKIDHADYRINSEVIKMYWKKVSETGSFNGLHKSGFNSEVGAEIALLPHPVHINRHHFLKFRIPDLYDHIEKSGLSYDASLGFAEQYGFRNSFGRPFKPYNLHKNRPYRFVEYPLHLMDATFIHYMGMDEGSMLHSMIQFIEKHRFNAVLGILLHNSTYNFHRGSLPQTWRYFMETLSRLKSHIPPGL